MAWVAGVDGCKSGWAVVLCNLRTGAFAARCVPRFVDLLTLPERPEVIAVDIPIGLLTEALPGGRGCDRKARAILGQKRASSVFSAPVRAALRETTHVAASGANRASSAANLGLSRQAFALFGKLREVDEVMTPRLQQRVHEVHPEVSFSQMNEGKPLVWNKKTLAGRTARRHSLRLAGFSRAGALVEGRGILGAAADDVLDALAACWTATRIHESAALALADEPFVDAKQLRMEIWH